MADILEEGGQRQYRDRLDPRAQAQATGRTASQQVVARPVDTYVAPAQDVEMLGLINGLAKISPELQSYALYKGINDTQAGADAKAANMELDPAKSKDFQTGYMLQTARVGGVNDRTEFLAQFATAFPKDGTGDFDKFTQEFIKAKTQGMDPALQQAWAKEFAVGVKTAQEQLANESAQQTIENTYAAALDDVKGSIQTAFNPDGSLNKGQAAKNIEEARRRANKLGITNSQFNKLLLEGLGHFGSQGNSEVYDIADMPRADGTPALSSIPGYSAKIDEGRLSAIRAENTRLAAEHARAKQSLAARQDAAMLPILQQAIGGDKDGALKAFQELAKSKPDLFTADEMFKWGDRIARWEAKDESATQKLNFASLAADVYSGRADQRRITAAIERQDISPNQGIQLMNVLASESRANRAEARDIAAMRRQSFSDPMFQGTLQNLTRALGPTNGLLENRPAYHQEIVADEKQAMLEWRNENPNATPEQMRERQMFQIERGQKRLKLAEDRALAEGKMGGDTRGLGSKPYASAAEIAADLRAGRISSREAVEARKRLGLQ